jgi:hypothetical protein
MIQSRKSELQVKPLELFDNFEKKQTNSQKKLFIKRKFKLLFQKILGARK